MTSNDRLEPRLRALEGRMERVEQSLERTSTMLELLVQAQTRTQQIADSNARAIQAWESRINQVEEDAEEERSRLRVDLNSLARSVDAMVEGAADLRQAARENVRQHIDFMTRFAETQQEIQRIWQHLNDQQ